MFPFQNRICNRLKAKPNSEYQIFPFESNLMLSFTRSAILATSIIELMSFPHSMNVIRRFLPKNQILFVFLFRMSNLRQQ